MRTRTLVLLGSLAAGVAAPVAAMWANVRYGDLVFRSDAVVVATLSDVVETSEGGVDYGRGRLSVEENLFGSQGESDVLDLRWQNPTELACPRDEHSHQEGRRGLWFLSIEQDGTARARHPRRFIALSDGKELGAALKEIREAMADQGDARLAIVEDWMKRASHLGRREPANNRMQLSKREGGPASRAIVGVAPCSLSWCWADQWMSRGTRPGG